MGLSKATTPVMLATSRCTNTPGWQIATCTSKLLADATSGIAGLATGLDSRESQKYGLLLLLLRVLTSTVSMDG